MSGKDERFRRLRPPASGDLFAHFGVALEPASAPAAESSPVVTLARACPQCGWYVTERDPSCCVCGRAEGG
ncbi:MAG TPA: hypothetical protein VFG69_02565 [Nannocystaceae bacterium]|nr:hypothetical protein [Nannocystaceae bacterium]